jgi:DNA polymerase-4
VELVKEVTNDIRERHYQAKTVTVKLRYGNFETFTRAKTMSAPTDQEEPVRKAAFECLKRFELENRRVRLLGVRLTGLEKQEL